MVRLLYPEKRLAAFIALFSIPLLFLPKVSLLAVAGETAGLRIDDFILLFMSFFLLLQRLFREQGLLKIEWIALLIFLASLSSFFTNYMFSLLEFPAPTPPKILYVFRFIEYFLFFYIGYYSSKTINLSRVLCWFLLWNGALLFLQKFNVLGGFTHVGYSSEVSSRTQGISSFPAEMGLILNMLFCFFLYYSPDFRSLSIVHVPYLKAFFKKTKLYLLSTLILILILFTGARIAVLSFLITFCYVFFKNRKRNLLNSLPLILLLLSACVLVTLTTKSIYERTTLFSMSNFSLVAEVWDGINLEITKPHERVIELEDDVDISWWMRVQNWVYFTKFYLSYPRFWLLGLGPGTAGVALDGSILRILVEGGIIGSFLYFKLFQCIYRQNKVLKLIVINYVVNMCFFDAHLAYKSMCFLFFLTGNFMALESAPSLTLRDLQNWTVTRFLPRMDAKKIN